MDGFFHEAAVRTAGQLVFDAIPYCGPGARPESAWIEWNFDPFLLVALAVAAGGFVLRKPSRATGLAGIGVLALIFVSPLCAMSAALFSVRVANHVLLVALAAPLLAHALGRLRSVEYSGGYATAATLLHTAIFWVWHAPAPYMAALSHDGVYWTMQLSILFSAMALWRALAGQRGNPFALLTFAIALAGQMGLLGALIVFAGEPLYAPHFLTPIPWGLTPLEDQQLAGLFMWVPGMLPYLACLVLVIRRWFASLQAEVRHP